MRDIKRLELIASLPRDVAFQEMPTADKREVVKTFIAHALDAFDEEHHALDNWESLDLRSALSAYDNGMYTAAVSFVERALTPAPERREFVGFNSATAATIAELRNRLAATH